MTSGRWRPALIAVALAAVAAAAHAQPPTSTAVDTARAYTEAGLAAERAGDYDAAIRFYRDAYDLVPHPLLLFNLGQAHRLAGNAEEALRHYQLYLDADPRDPQREPAIRHIAALRAKLTATWRRRQEVSTPPADDHRSPPADDHRSSRSSAADLQASRSSAEAPARGRGARLVGLGLAGAGLAALGVGAIYGMRARTLADELSQPGARYDPAKVEAGEDAELGFAIATALGGGLVIGGAVLYLRGRSSAGPSRVVVAPALGQVVGVTVSGELR